MDGAGNRSDGAPVRLMAMSELESAAGVPRSTIHYYLREGLLPSPTRTATNRTLYTDSHLDLLGEIRRLQLDGLPLDAIKSRLETAVSSVRPEEVDLSKQSEALRRSILETAARAFAANGYKRTRVADIIRKLGITPQLFYGQFPTKLKLFLECLDVFSEWAIALTEPRTVSEADTAKHAALRAFGYLGLREISPDLLRLARAEAMQEDVDSVEVLRKSYERLVHTVLPDLLALHRSDRPAPFPSDELVAHAFMGILEATVGRLSWDDKYSKRDVLLTVLYLWLGIEAVYTGSLTVEDSRRREYEEWVEHLAQSPVPVPRQFRQDPSAAPAG